MNEVKRGSLHDHSMTKESLGKGRGNPGTGLGLGKGVHWRLGQWKTEMGFKRQLRALLLIILPVARTDQEDRDEEIRARIEGKTIKKVKEKRKGSRKSKTRRKTREVFNLCQSHQQKKKIRRGREKGQKVKEETKREKRERR